MLRDPESPRRVTLLMTAAAHGQAHLMQELLLCGADPNVEDSQGRTALFHAAKHGMLRSILELKDRKVRAVSYTHLRAHET